MASNAKLKAAKEAKAAYWQARWVKLNERLNKQEVQSKVDKASQFCHGRS